MGIKNSIGFEFFFFWVSILGFLKGHGSEFFFFFLAKVVEPGLCLSCCRMVFSESCESHVRFLILVKADVDG